MRTLILPHLNAMNKLLVSGLLILSLAACSKGDGGGVIARPETSAPTSGGNDGPFGGAVPGDGSVPGPSVYLPPYSSFDLEALIFSTPAGGTIALDRDVNLTYTVFINKSITFTSAASLGRRAVIKGQNLSSFFTTVADNITFRNVSLNLINTTQFLFSSLDINGTPTQSNLTIDKVLVYLRGSSSFEVAMNATQITNSSILGLASGRLVTTDPNQQIPGVPMTKFRGNNLLIQGSNIIDVNNSYATSLVLFKNQNVIIRQNVIRCYCEKLTGTISGTDLNNVSIEGNILHDANAGRQNKDFPDPDVDGSISIVLQYVNNVRDNGVLNKYNSEKFVVDDQFFGNSTNINLTSGFTVPAFSSNQLFNNRLTEDFTPICALGSNPSLSTSIMNTWLSYVVPSSSINLYYSGALRPACL